MPEVLVGAGLLLATSQALAARPIVALFWCGVLLMLVGADGRMASRGRR